MPKQQEELLDLSPLTSPSAKAEPELHHLGHRARLRERFFASLNTSGQSTLPDYELLELALFAASPRSDVKPLAKRLLKTFGSLGGVIAARREELSQVDGLSDAGIAAVKLLQAVSANVLSEEISKRPVLRSWKQVLSYCELTMARARKEQFRIFFLDKKNMLITDELQQEGTVDHTPVYPREVVRRALELGASAIILVHNHPSGDPSPSQADITMTRAISQALASVEITIHDHLIVGGKEHFSFASNGLL